MEWQDDDEFTTTFGSMKLAQSQAFELGAEFERSKAMKQNIEESYLADVVVKRLDELKAIIHIVAAYQANGMDAESALRQIMSIIVEENR
jgi:hypothetical protein